MEPPPPQCFLVNALDTLHTVEVQRRVVHGHSTPVLLACMCVNRLFRDMVLLPEVMVDVQVQGKAIAYDAAMTPP